MNKDELLGKTIEEAKNILKEKNIKYRTVREDNEHFMVTADFRIDRVNLQIDNGIVTAVTFG